MISRGTRVPREVCYLKTGPFLSGAEPLQFRVQGRAEKEAALSFLATGSGRMDFPTAVLACFFYFSSLATELLTGPSNLCCEGRCYAIRKFLQGELYRKNCVTRRTLNRLAYSTFFFVYFTPVYNRLLVSTLKSVVSWSVAKTIAQIRFHFRERSWLKVKLLV